MLSCQRYRDKGTDFFESDLWSEGEAMHISADENYGCLFCRSGQELSVMKDLKLLHPEFRYIVPQKKRYRRIGKELHEEIVTLFPGYIFFKAAAKSSVVSLQSHRHVYRVLCNAEQDWRLQGTDHHFVDRLFAENGVVGFSKAIYVDGRIVITGGFLEGKNYEIISVNRRAKTLQVRFKFADTSMIAWLGYELE